MRNMMLIGFMGTGKSTVATCMGREYDMEIIEMDEMIAKREGMTIPEIFAKHSEMYFRDLETNLVLEIQSMHNKVVSCGGGVVLRQKNVEAMKKAGVIVLLTATPETILSRVEKDDNRPLLQGNKNIESIEKMLKDRQERYEAAADIVVETDNKTATEICREIVDRIRED